MADSDDTVIITGIPEHVEGKEFIDFVSKAGEIMTGKKTGQRMAEIKRTAHTTGKALREGIVTYTDGHIAAKALAILNGKKLQGSAVTVKAAGEIYKYTNIETRDCQNDLNMKDPRCLDYNNAWRYFWQKDNVCYGENHVAKGGRGGRGMGPGHDGEDGQPGEDGPNGGRGGQGGKAGKAGFFSGFFSRPAPPQPPHNPPQHNNPPRGSNPPPLD